MEPAQFGSCSQRGLQNTPNSKVLDSQSSDYVTIHFVDQLPVQWKQPATKGDLSDQAEITDAMLAKMDAWFDDFLSDLQATIRRDVWVSTAATMALNLAALGLVVSILK